MTGRTRNGQLRPLEERMNAHQQEKREQRIFARRTVAQRLGRDVTIIANAFSNFGTMPTWKRWQWVVLGPAYVGTRTGSIVLAAIIAAIAALTGYVLFK